MSLEHAMKAIPSIIIIIYAFTSTNFKGTNSSNPQVQQTTLISNATPPLVDLNKQNALEPLNELGNSSYASLVDTDYQLEEAEEDEEEKDELPETTAMRSAKDPVKKMLKKAKKKVHKKVHKLAHKAHDTLHHAIHHAG